MSIGIRLREKRIEAGMTQADLAALGGVSSKTQGLYEQDKRSPDAKYLSAVQEKIDVSYVVSGRPADGAVKAMLMVVQLADQFDLAAMDAARTKEMCEYIYKSNSSYEDMAAAFKAVGVAERNK